ncbi:tetratricopeptide repeat protein [Photobacterium nomapromontoriensis]|uniref:tetratricopeptide repeat protein n=1 Tax=Photobacterium nomapromontoriensis TaxID=2910237 RepID=UPI003D0CE459
MINRYRVVFALYFSLLVISGPVAAELSQFTANKVQRANTLQQEDKVGDAIALLRELEPSRAYDKAFVQRMLGVFYWQQGNVSSAISYLSKAVSSGLLQDEQAWTTQRMLADILLSDEQFNKALPHYYALAKQIPEGQNAAELWLRIAQSHYQLSQWQPVLSAIVKHDRYTQKKEVSLLTMKLGAQLQLQQLKASLPTLEQLIVLEPNKSVWWQQMAGIQLRIGHSKAALETLALARRQGIDLSQQDLKTLAQLYAQQGIPERAATVYAQLDKAKTNAELVSMQAQYWQMAKEWDQAIESWQLAAKLDKKYHWPLAQLLLQEGHYEQAIIALNKVSDKRYTADVELAKVRAFYKLNNFEQAIVHAKLADNIRSTSASKSWIQYLNQMRKMHS